MDQQHVPSKPPSLWHNRDYLLLWLGEAVSSVGTGISQFAFPLLILLITNSFAAAGISGALLQLPYFLFSLPAGALVDRWDRKRVMLISALGLAVCLASVPVALIIGHLTIVQIYAVSFVMGICFVFYQLAELAALTQLVPTTQLSTAVAQNEAAYSITQLLSPSLGGLLLSAGYIFPFLADFLSYCILLGSLLVIKTPFQVERREGSRHLFAEVWEGIRWLWSHAVVRSLAFATSYQYVIMGASVLIVYAIARQQHISLVIVGIILSLGGGGNIAGTLIGPLIQRRARFGWALAAMFALFVLVWPLYSLAHSPVVLGAIIIAIATLDSITVILVVSYRLAVVPNELRGRVVSVFRLIYFALLALGQFAVGQCLERFGVLPTIAILWAGLLLFALLALLYSPLRRASFPS